MVRAALMLAGTILLAGCGQSRDAPQAGSPTPERRVSPGTSQPRDDAQRARPVIQGWSDALRRSDVERAIGYFALPSVVQQGSAFKLTTRGQVRIFNAGLPCGARLQGVERSGRYVVGTFKLTERPGKTCDGPGNLARVAFIVRDGKIGEWRQLAAPEAPDPSISEA